MASSSSEMNKQPVMSADQFFEGLIAALAARNERHLTATQNQLHKAVRTVLCEVNRQNCPEVDLRDVDYDPLYGLSGWFDHFLARAQRDLLISFPNPSYGKIEIQLTQEEGKRLVNELGHEKALDEFSQLFVQELHA